MLLLFRIVFFFLNFQEEFNRQQHEEDEELQRILALTMKDFSGEDELARIQVSYMQANGL